MLDLMNYVVSFIPREIIVPIVAGGAIVAAGLFFLPPTYHWDGKVPAEPRR